MTEYLIVGCLVTAAGCAHPKGPRVPVLLALLAVAIWPVVVGVMLWEIFVSNR